MAAPVTQLTITGAVAFEMSLALNAGATRDIALVQDPRGQPMAVWPLVRTCPCQRCEVKVSSGKSGTGFPRTLAPGITAVDVKNLLSGIDPEPGADGGDPMIMRHEVQVEDLLDHLLERPRPRPDGGRKPGPTCRTSPWSGRR